jgi:hypothetical protein
MSKKRRKRKSKNVYTIWEKIRKRKKDGRTRNIHHIIPSSREPLLRNDPDNVVLIDEKLHTKYHALFENMTPPEIIDFLVKYFWNGKTIYINQYMREILKEVCHDCEI